MTQKTPLEANDSMTDNPAYNQVSLTHAPHHSQQKQSSMSNSTMSSTSVHIEADTSLPQSHHFTICCVPNPVYGYPSDKNMGGNVYRSPGELLRANSHNSVGELEYSYVIVESSANCAANKTSRDKNGRLQSTKTFVEREYAMVDKSKKTINVAVLSHDQGAPPYERLEHGQGIAKQSQTQTTVRLADDEDIGYSALT